MIVFYITSAHSCRVNWGRPLWKGPLCRVHSPLAKSSASAFNRSYRQHLKDLNWGLPLWKTPLCRVHSFVPNARSSTALVENLPRFVLLSAKHFDTNQPTITWSSPSLQVWKKHVRWMFPGCGSHNYFGDFSHILSWSNLLYSYQTMSLWE